MYPDESLCGSRLRHLPAARLPVLDLRLYQAPIQDEVLAGLLGALDFEAQRIQRVKLVESGLCSHAVRVFRRLDRLDQQLDLVGREVEGPVDDLFHLDMAVDGSLDDFVGVRDDLRTRRPEELFGSSERYTLESRHYL